MLNLLFNVILFWEIVLMFFLIGIGLFVNVDLFVFRLMDLIILIFVGI